MAEILPDSARARIKAGQLLRSGGLVAFPTDTLYGLGAMLNHPRAIERLFAIKGRSFSKGLPILVKSMDQTRNLVSNFPALAVDFARQFWPGALTMILPKHNSVPIGITGSTTIAIRQPDHPSALALISECGSPITGTSANLSGMTPSINAQEVLKQLGESIDLIIDGGTCNQTVPSTILDLTQNPPRVLREGAISIKALQEISPLTILVGPH